MSAPTAEFGPSWLASLPDGATVLRREVDLCTVTAIADEWFSARMPGRKRRQYFDPALVADDDKPLLEPGAKFWRVAEWTRPGDVTWGIRFQRSGVSAEQAFARDTKAAAR